MNILHIFTDALRNIHTLPKDDAVKVFADLEFLKIGRTEALAIKSLRRKIKELIVGQYRIAFFQWGETIYVVDVFKKQSRKTPRRVIERAENIYRALSTSIDEKYNNEDESNHR